MATLEFVKDINTENVDIQPTSTELTDSNSTSNVAAEVEPGISYPNGDCFVGELSNGKRSGLGRYAYSNGDVYTGYFVEGRKSGVGKLELFHFNEVRDSLLPPCSYYHGEFANGVMSGDGTYRYLTGDVYSGGWLNGAKHGTGTYYYANDGGSLEGDWLNGEFVSGDWTLPNGDVFTGSFVNGKPNGIGKWRLANCKEELHGSYDSAWKFTV